MNVPLGDQSISADLSSRPRLFPPSMTSWSTSPGFIDRMSSSSVNRCGSTRPTGMSIVDRAVLRRTFTPSRSTTSMGPLTYFSPRAKLPTLSSEKSVKKRILLPGTKS